MERPEHIRIGDILTQRGIISQKQLNEAMQEQKVTGRRLGEVLVSRGVLTEEQLARALSEQLGLAYVDLSTMTVEPQAIELVPEEVALRLLALPLFIIQDTITVAMANPLDVTVVDEIRSLANLSVKPVFACPSAIRQAVEKYYHRKQPEPEEEYLPQPHLDYGKLKPSGTDELGIADNQIASLKQAASLAPVIDMVNGIIEKAVEMGASDIHLEPAREHFKCRYRVDGILYPASEISLADQAAVLSRIKIMANMDIAEKRLPQDGRIRMSASGRDVDLRVSTFPTVYGENMVIRILDRSAGILKLEQLGFLKEAISRFLQLIHRPYGIILVTGPTGSGKTSTLYAALSEINSLEKNIITLEDPVEYEIANVRQSQVNIKAGLTFASGLRSIVRQDPDIIMIGEIRDKETADIAIHASLTGHLVFSTLHTNDAPSATTRLIDMGIEPFLVSSSLIGVLAQRLVRTLCPSCKQEYAPSSELLKQLELKEHKEYIFYKETGCKKCKQRGYLGRTGIFELLVPDDSITELINEKASAAVIRDAAVKQGMKTLRDAGIEKVTEGVTSVSEVLRVTEEV